MPVFAENPGPGQGMEAVPNPTWKTGFRQMFSLDLRSLALFRIGVSLLILADLLIRAQSLVAHYTDAGVLPRSVQTTIFNADWYFSFHLMTGSWEGESLLFLVAGAFAVMLLVGYRTRLACILSWLMMISLHNRNYLLLNSGDFSLRMLLFWGMFLPLGARASVDRMLLHPVEAQEPPSGNSFVFPGGIGLICQIVFVYFFSALFKWAEPAWRDGLGV